MDRRDDMNTKGALRLVMKERLNNHAGPLSAIHPHLIAWLNARPTVRIITIFAPLHGEPDILPVMDGMPEIRWCFPRVVDASRLMFHEVVNPTQELRVAAFGIREPPCDALEVPIHKIDAFLCPGLAFDRRGGRLGRGRGYYDRMMADARADALKIGVCFSCQLVDSTFSEPHDVRMDVVISEFGTTNPEH